MINVYAPVDGEIKKIQDLKDGVFSEKMLGSGFFIKPESSEIHPVLEKSTVFNIFDTKHAYILKQEKVSLLIHVGIDTVNLKGKPFNVLVKEKQIIGLEKVISKVDFEMIRENYNDAVCVTFLNENDFTNSEFKLLKKGKVKQGEKIGEIILVDNPEPEKVEFKNRYQKLAEDIYRAVGKEENYTKFWNCITRLRFAINDKTKVDEEKLKSLKSIQGFVWSGNELQIVIGADVIKARDAYEKYLIQKDQPQNYEVKKDTFLNVTKKSISGVMTMLIPYLVASGMLYAIFSILQNVGLVESVWIDYTDPNNITWITDYSVMTGVFYIICTSGLAFMGFAFGYCTIKFMGGNTVIGSMICLILIGIPLYGGLSWNLFKIGEVNFSIGGYANLVIPQVSAAIFYVYFDRWVKTWIPSVVDLILRHLITVFVTLTLTFFLMGPLMGLLELVFFYLLEFIDSIPFGISVAAFSFLAPILTVMGIAWAVSAPITASVAQGIPSAMSCAWYLGEFAMAGSTFAVCLKTKNGNTKKLALNSGITAMFGVSEPALYTVLLPRYKPFIFSLVGASFSGLIVGILGLKVYAQGGGGIFFFTQFIQGGIYSLLIASLGLVISFGVSFLLTFFFWKEKINQAKELNKTNKFVLGSVTRFAKKENKNLNLESFKERLNGLNKEFDQNFIAKQKEVDISLNERLVTEVKLNTIRDKIEKRNEKIVLKIKKTNPENASKIEMLKRKLANNSFEKIEGDLSLKLIELNQKTQTLVDELNETSLKIVKNIDIVLKDISKESNFEEITKIINQYSNIVYNVEIFYDYKIPLEIEINKNIYKKISKGEILNAK